jgi:hypothetical protein
LRLSFSYSFIFAISAEVKALDKRKWIDCKEI